MTLTGTDDKLSKKWEPNAPLPGDRIATLKAFHVAGIFTWVSLEPVVDVEASLAVVAATHSFVNPFKIGRMNYHTLPINWRAFTLRMVDRLARHNARAYFKKDLQPYLPPRYLNPIRVPQHHGGVR